MFKKQDLIKEERKARELQEERDKQMRLEIERQVSRKYSENADSSTIL
jgi:hypothetical protein